MILEFGSICAPPHLCSFDSRAKSTTPPCPSPAFMPRCSQDQKHHQKFSPKHKMLELSKAEAK